MKKTAVLSGLMALTLLLGGCSAQQAGGETPTTPPAAAATVDPAEKTTGVGFYFDTVVTITLYGADDALMEDIWAACKRYENMLSKTVEGSDVSRINNAHGQTVTVDAETWNVLSEAKKLNRLTGGAFAITIAPLTAQWDFTGGTNRIPTDEERSPPCRWWTTSSSRWARTTRLRCPLECKLTSAASPRATLQTKWRHWCVGGAAAQC